MRITSKGQVTIPQHIRDRYGMLPETEVDFVEQGGKVIVVRSTPGGDDRAARAVAAMRGSGNRRLTTDEIMALTRDIDA